MYSSLNGHTMHRMQYNGCDMMMFKPTRNPESGIEPFLVCKGSFTINNSEKSLEYILVQLHATTHSRRFAYVGTTCWNRLS